MEHDLELFGRIVVAALLGGVVGWERYVRGQMAAVAVLAGAGDAVLAIVVAALVLLVLELRYIPLPDHLDARHWSTVRVPTWIPPHPRIPEGDDRSPEPAQPLVSDATVARGRLRTRARSSDLRRNG